MDDALRPEVADELEAADSPLCDCSQYGPPTNGSKRLAHHCDCPAVSASATIRRGLTPTLHERECGHMEPRP